MASEPSLERLRLLIESEDDDDFDPLRDPPPIAALQRRPEDMMHDDDTRHSGGGRRFGLRRLLPVGLALLALVSFGAIVWEAYKWGTGAGDVQEVPIIVADSEPIKTRPAEPGGLDVPHQDKLVLNEITPDPAQPQVERLLPPPEVPRPPQPAATVALPESDMAPAGSEAAPNEIEAVQNESVASEAPVVESGEDGAAATEPQASEETEAAATAPPEPGPTAGAAANPQEPDAAASAGEDTDAAREVQEVAEVAPPPAAPTESTAVKAAEQEPPAPKAEATPEAASKAEPKQQPAAPKQQAAAANGRFLVQLGALKTRASAEREWGRLAKAFPQLLGARTSRIQTVDVAGKGKFHRVQAGYFGDRASADALCARLKAQKQACIVVRR